MLPVLALDLGIGDAKDARGSADAQPLMYGGPDGIPTLGRDALHLLLKGPILVTFEAFSARAPLFALSVAVRARGRAMRAARGCGFFVLVAHLRPPFQSPHPFYLLLFNLTRSDG